MNYRHHSFSSRDSSASLSDREDDAITPVEEDSDHHEEDHHEEAPLRQTATASSHFDNPFDNARLWRRMLALQRQYHCYNSARMSAALEDKDVEAVVPPRACLDLLNDSMTTAWLCEEARAEAAALLTLVPDGIRSRTGSYGDIYEDSTKDGPRTPTNTPTTTGTQSPATTSLNSRPTRRQECMHRKRGLRRSEE